MCVFFCPPGSILIGCFDSLGVWRTDPRAALLLAEEKHTLLAKGIIPAEKLISVPVSLIKLIWSDIFKTVLWKHMFKCIPID